MNFLELKNISKQIDKSMLVKNLNMTVKEGEVYGFLGPNGAGKTTTIRLIVGLIRPTTGSIKIMGHDIQRNRKQALSHIGTIVENPDTYSYLSGRKNLLHYARLAGLTKKERTHRIEEVTDLVRLTDRIDDKVKTYSLGMRQRLGVAQALLGRPRLLILDEPTNGLDPAGIREFRDLIRHLAQQGMSIFVSSHLLSEIQMMCDRVAVLNKGSIVKEANVTELLKQTSLVSLRVANPDYVASILQKEGLQVATREANTVTVHMSEERISSIIQLLSSQNITIYEVKQVQNTLEDMFLKLTEEA